MKGSEHYSRRALLRRGGIAAAAAPALLRAGGASSATPAPTTSVTYESIGVKPVINCRGTYTIIGGSLELPEVRAAQDVAARHYVQLDELMDGIGKRLAEITGAEWGMVSSGCAAALAHATAACVAGGNPDLHVRLPDLTGFAKDEVIIPAHSRNVYDAAVRSTGIRVVEVADVEQYERALGPRVAMVYVLAGPNAEKGALTYDDIYRLAQARNLPVLVDAAAEVLTIPNVHLKRGATLVAYSGGKCIRGPQCAGLLLGRKDLVRAAWMHSAPHHGYSRSMKLGKEEAMGMLAAVEAWTRRDHQGEWNQWMGWLHTIGGRVETIPGITTSIDEPTELSNHTPTLHIRWDTSKVGISGRDVEHTLFTSDPRITLFGREDGVSIVAYMMAPGDDKVVADRLHATLSAAPNGPVMNQAKPAAADISGEWDVHITYLASETQHRVYIRQDGNRLEGTHQGDFVARDLFGSIDGSAVRFHSDTTERHGQALSYTFTGTATSDSMEGDLDMGEYLKAKWSAKRHEFARG
ncbi:MAG TPA: aminotransferase class V-fold PLP-dependent enzyme [Bryobacteraceae bacterium]|nr:aminotransferase class V-fold PLP-dependent enzyme [Bryobacteraceae bacterium]